MGKKTHDSVFDAASDKISTATRMTLCSAEPADFAGIAALALADVVMAGGDYAKANGDVSGRKVTVAAKAAQAVDNTGSGNHVALDDGATLLHVATTDAIAVTQGGTVDFPAWDIEFADPA